MKEVPVKLYICFFILCLPGFLSYATARDSEIIPPGNVTQKIISSIAFGSCAKHWQPQPIWDVVIAHNPDLWLFLGDTIYADTDDGSTALQVTKEQLVGEWNRLADKPEFRMAGPIIEWNFGLVTIDWRSHPPLIVSLDIVNEIGAISLTHQTELSELQ